MSHAKGAFVAYNEQTDDQVQQADFITTLSNEMIADIVEEWMNKKKEKRPVKVVDLKSTDVGYMFFCAFVQAPPKVVQKDMKWVTNNGLNDTKVDVRDDKGRFVKVKQYE